MSKAKPYTPSKEQSQLPHKSILLTLFLVPLFISLLLALIRTDIKAFLLNSITFFLFLAVSRIAQKGFDAEAKYNESIFTKAPKIPYKVYAGYLLAGSTFFASFIAGDKPFVIALFLSAIALLGYHLFYGTDPKTDKLENLGDVSAEFVIETITEARGKLDSIRESMTKIKETTLHEKLTLAVNKSETILQTIQEDPKDVRIARKFLIVYIDGIKNVINAYTSIEEEEISPERKEKLNLLMDDVEIRLNKELARLKENNNFDLDVHMDVLQAQIKQ